jgi:hypothetical protein
VATSSGSSHHAVWALLAWVLVVLLPAFAAAQEPVKSFDQLNTPLKVGETVWVTDTQGREVTGKIRELHDASITIDGDGGATFAAERVREVQHRRHDSVWTGGLIGLGAGAAFGWLAAGRGCGVDPECLLWEGVPGALGMCIGLIVDALIPGKRVVAYRAAGAPGAASARLSVSPVLTRSTKGVSVAFSF